MKDLLVFPAWTKANGPDHYIVCVRNYFLLDIECLIDMLITA